MGFLQDARAVWKTLVIIITPIVLVPLVLPASSQESKCSYVLVVMAVYWVTEALPLAVTAMLPVLLLPLLGIMPSSAVCQLYIKDVIFLLIGGLTVAVAIEESNLHKRFALRLLLLMGVQPRKLLLGFMVSTAFLSMWITNTATTAMMTPIARALLHRLFTAQHHRKQEIGRLPQDERDYTWPIAIDEEVKFIAMERGKQDDHNTEISVDPVGADVTKQKADGTKDEMDVFPPRESNLDKIRQSEKDKGISEGEENDDDGDDEDEDDQREVRLNVEQLDSKSAKLVKALCLCVCYAANIGGVGTLTGTGPNIVYKNYVETLSNGEQSVSFLEWMAFGLPVAAVNLVVAWLWLQLTFFGVKKTLLCQRQTSPEEDKALEHYLRREQRKMGNMSFAEKVVLGHFLVLVALWLTRSPGVFPGWAVFFPKKHVSDAIPAVLVAVSLFVFPREKPAIFCCRGNKGAYKSIPSVLQWQPLSRKFPWGVVLLLGGGFALAEATKVSGLSKLIAQQLMIIGSLPAWVACLVVVIVTSVTTEVTSNTVIATLILPILAEVAVSMNLHPVYFMLPATVASSFAFMLPVATPPNAIVFAHGDLKVMDMMKTGVALNVICITVVIIAISTFGQLYLGLDHVPQWAYTLIRNTPAFMLNSTDGTVADSVTTLADMYQLPTSNVQSVAGNWTTL